tara:strand:+ start:64827 stop:66218 length:1392 start_codon:yes stop_codon:yes gene_type:complete
MEVLNKNSLFFAIYKKKYPIKVISSNCLKKHPFDIQKKIFFKLHKEIIYLADSHEKLAIYGDYEISNKSINFYQSSGLIIPPNTIFKEIYIVPVGFKFSYENQDFILEKKINCKGEGIIDSLGKLIDDNYKYKDVNLLFSGGADSSLLLYLMRKHKPKLKIKSIFFNSGNLKDDFKRAKKLAFILDSELYEVVPRKEDPKVVKKFIIKQTYNLKELIYEPILFTIDSIFREIPDGSIVFDGQGADTVLGGLPHHLLIQIYSLKIVRLFAKLEIFSFLKKLFKPIRNKSRFYYRIYKLLISLNEKKLSACLINSLLSTDKPFKKNDMYYMHEKIINIFLNEYDEISTVSLFFLSILSSRELQKYKLNMKLVYCLPYLDPKFIHYCLSISKDLKCKLNRRKIPIIDFLNKNLPLKFSSNQQLPFEPHSSHVLSELDNKNYDPLIKSKNIRDISIKALYKKYMRIN